MLLPLLLGENAGDRTLGGRTGGGGGSLRGGFVGAFVRNSARSSAVKARKSWTLGSWNTDADSGLTVTWGSCTYESLQSSSSSAALEMVARVVLLDGTVNTDSRLISLLVFGSLKMESRCGIISGEGSGVNGLRMAGGNRPRVLEGGEGKLNSSWSEAGGVSTLTAG